MQTSRKWSTPAPSGFRTRTGIEQRHVASEEELTSDLCVEAAKVAMESAGVGPEDIDLIVVGTTSPDLIFPNIADHHSAQDGNPRVCGFQYRGSMHRLHLCIEFGGTNSFGLEIRSARSLSAPKSSRS